MIGAMWNYVYGIDEAENFKHGIVERGITYFWLGRPVYGDRRPVGNFKNKKECEKLLVDGDFDGDIPF